MNIDLRVLGQVESVVADQDRQNSLKQAGAGRVSRITPKITYMSEVVHLEFCQRKVLAQTYLRTIGECQYMLVPLNFLRSPKAIYVKPSLRLEFPRVGTPEFHRAVQVRDGWRDNSPLTNQEARDFFTCSRCNRSVGWNDIIFCSLRSFAR